MRSHFCAHFRASQSPRINSLASASFLADLQALLLGWILNLQTVLLRVNQHSGMATNSALHFAVTVLEGSLSSWSASTTRLQIGLVGGLLRQLV